MYMYAGAYVKIEESVMYLPIKSQLRVYSAGVLNNLALACLSALLLVNLPVVLGLLGFGTTSDSLVIVALNPASVLRGHLRVGEHIGFLNDQPVTSLEGLSQILRGELEHFSEHYLSSIPFGPKGGTLDSQLRHKYDSPWAKELNASSPLEFNPKVYYGPGVCAPHTLTDLSLIHI